MNVNVVVLKEQMKNEGRVALTPEGCLQACRFSTVWVEAGAGEESGYLDRDYRAAGARVLSLSDIVSFLLFAKTDTVVLKVKQPIPADFAWLDQARDCTIMAYFHSTGENERYTIDALLKNNITAVSYENITEDNGRHPILIPMSVIAGRRAVEIGRKLLPHPHLQMLIVGGGAVGVSAAEEGLRRGFARIVIFEERAPRAIFLEKRFISRVKVFSPADHGYDLARKREFKNADLLIGAAAVLGHHAPKAVTLPEVESMSKGSVIVDVSIDQGGCVERPENANETHFEHNGVTFCCIPNLPGSVPKESTPVLAEAILPYLLDVLQNGAKGALCVNSGLRTGLITYGGKVTDKEAAAYWGEQYTDPITLLRE